MSDLGGRTVFFVRDAQRSLRFYVESLGFVADWNHQEDGKAFVCQVILLGFQLILNQTEPGTEDRAGHGRVFFGLDDDQIDTFREHVRTRNIKTGVMHWGAPTLVIRDLDGNELFFWYPESARAGLEAQLPGG